MSDNTDFYKILNLSKNASQEEIKKKWRVFAQKYHPDAQYGKTDEEKKTAEELFKQGQAAYECLSNPEKRKKYDEYGVDGLNGKQSNFNENNISDFIRKHMSDFGFNFNPFGSEFNENSCKNIPNINDPEDGKSFRIEFSVDLEDIIFGSEKEFSINNFSVCPDCHGHKCEEYIKCDVCHGSGVKRLISGNVFYQKPCSKCNGSGYVMKNICKTCDGYGRIESKRKYKVKIPIGLQENEQLRIKNGGIVGLNGGKDGDLYIIISINEHSIFKRISKFDLSVNVYVNPISAIYGYDISIPTPYGMHKYTLPKGTKNGETIKLEGFGIKGNNLKGNLLVKIIYDTIDLNSLDEETEQLLKKVSLLLDKNDNCLINERKLKKKLLNSTNLPWIETIKNKQSNI